MVFKVMGAQSSEKQLQQTSSISQLSWFQHNATHPIPDLLPPW